MTLTVYRRAACKLCDQADRILESVLRKRVLQGQPAPALAEVTIDGDPELETRFGARIPVIELAGAELGPVLSGPQLAAFLDRVLPRVA
jgi:hypothetical protein